MSFLTQKNLTKQIVSYEPSFGKIYCYALCFNLSGKEYVLSCVSRYLLFARWNE